jgi:hypothetical protein
MPNTSPGREAALLEIVNMLARAEAKIRPGATDAVPTYNREWLFAAFAFARECLDGPRPAVPFNR